MFSVFLTKLTVSSCQGSDRGPQINHHLDNTTIGEYPPYTLRVHMKLYIDLSSPIGLNSEATKQHIVKSNHMAASTNLHDYIHSIQVSNMATKKNGFQTAA